MYVNFLKNISGRNEQNCIHCFNPQLKWNISIFTFFAYFLTINMVSGKSPQEINTRKIPPVKFPAGGFHRKTLTQKIPTQNIPTHVFKHFVFLLLSPLSLVLLKRLFCISFLKKCWSKTCYSVLKKFYSLPAIREMFWIWWKCFPYFNSGNIQL